MTTQPPEGQRPERDLPEYEPPDFPPRGHRHPIPRVSTGASHAADDAADRAAHEWQDRATGRPTMFGSAVAIFVVAVLVVLLVLWLVGVF